MNIIHWHSSQHNTFLSEQKKMFVFFFLLIMLLETALGEQSAFVEARVLVDMTIDTDYFLDSIAAALNVLPHRLNIYYSTPFTVGTVLIRIRILEDEMNVFPASKVATLLFEIAHSTRLVALGVVTIKILPSEFDESFRSPQTGEQTAATCVVVGVTMATAVGIFFGRRHYVASKTKEVALAALQITRQEQLQQRMLDIETVTAKENADFESQQKAWRDHVTALATLVQQQQTRHAELSRIARANDPPPPVARSVAPVVAVAEKKPPPDTPSHVWVSRPDPVEAMAPTRSPDDVEHRLARLRERTLEL